MSGEAAVPPLRLAIIGAGLAGRRFAQLCLQHGQSFILEDVLPAKLRTAADELSEQNEAFTALVSLVSSVEDAVRDADLVIDFVPDELESKLEIFSLLDRMAPPRTILLTPTDALSIADLASCTYRPDRCFALHRLALGPDTAQATHAADSKGLRLTYPASRDAAAQATVEQLLTRLGLPFATALDEMPSMLTGR